MTNEEVIKMIRNHRGPICAGVLARDHVIYIDVTKQALYEVISGYRNVSDSLTFEVHNGTLYIDNQRN